MQAEAARLMVELAIIRSLKEIRQGDCRRALRSMVEDGRHFIRRGYPSKLISTMQEMLRADAHPYYDLFARLANRLDARYFTGYLTNLCYESWIRGAHKLRQQQKRLGRRIPWVISLDLDGLGLTGARQLIDQGTTLGVMCYVLATRQIPIDALQALCAAYPRCALAAFVPDEALTAPVLDALDGTDNLLLIASRAAGAFQSAPLMRARRRLYALCRPIDEAGIERLMATEDLTCPGDDACAFPVLLPRPGVPAELRQRMNEWVEQLRQRPLQPLFPVDAGLDFIRVDRLISGGSSALWINANGEFHTGPDCAPTGHFFPQVTLEEALAGGNPSL